MVAGGGQGILAAAVVGTRLIDGALPAAKSVGILCEINIVVEIRHYRDQPADDNGSTVTRVGVSASGTCEIKTGRHGAQRDDRGFLPDGHEDSLPAVSALVAVPVRLR
jgi:hypothetical protein